MITAPVERIVKQLNARGLKVVRGPEPGSLVLKGPPEARTPALMDALKVYREDLAVVVWAEPDAVTADPKPLPTTAPPRSEWETCTSCKAEVLAAEMPTSMALCDTPGRCPYRAGTPARSYARPSAPSSPSGPGGPSPSSRPGGHGSRPGQAAG